MSDADIRSINEPLTVRKVMLTPNSINEPRPLPTGIPSIDGINPTSVPEGTASQLIVVHGSNLTEGCVVNFNGVDQPTTYERADKINATVALAGLPADTYPVTVGLFGAESPPQIFMITAAEAAGLADPDELEEEIEESKEDGDFKPTHRRRGK